MLPLHDGDNVRQEGLLWLMVSERFQFILMQKVWPQGCDITGPGQEAINIVADQGTKLALVAYSFVPSFTYL